MFILLFPTLRFVNIQSSWGLIVKLDLFIKIIQFYYQTPGRVVTYLRNFEAEKISSPFNFWLLLKLYLLTLSTLITKTASVKGVIIQKFIDFFFLITLFYIRLATFPSMSVCYGGQLIPVVDIFTGSSWLEFVGKSQ